MYAFRKKALALMFFLFMFGLPGLSSGVETCATIPGAVSLTAPTGTTTDTTPTLTWNSDACATWYKVYLSSTDGYKFVQWYEIEDNFGNYPEVNCSDGTCTVTPDVTLPTGNYEWWVQTWNVNGNGAWSSTGSFVIQDDETCTTIPGAVSLTAPTGTTTDTTPTLTWNSDACATWYKVYLSNTTGYKFVQWYEIEDNFGNYPEVNCSGGTCTVTPDVTLPTGNYQWWVQTWNVNGNGAWSSTGSFVIQDDGTCTTIPGAVSLTAPAGATTDTTPTLTWNSNACATWYKVYLSNTAGYKFVQWYEIEDNSGNYPEVNCSGGTCTVTPNATLPDGNYQWWVQTWNNHGNGPWSSGKSFTLTSSKIERDIDEVIGMASSVGDLSPMIEEIGTLLGEIMNGDSSIVTITPPIDMENPLELLSNPPPSITISANFGSGYTPEGSTSVLTGSMVINATNISYSQTGITANVSLTASNIRRDGQLVLNGGITLGFNMGVGPTSDSFAITTNINFSNLQSLDFQVNGAIGLNAPSIAIDSETDEISAQPITVTFQQFTTLDYQVSGDIQLTQTDALYDILFTLNTNQGTVAGTLRVDGTDPSAIIISTPGANLQAGGYSLDINNVIMAPDICTEKPSSGNIVIKDTGTQETKTITYNSNCTYAID